MSSCSGKIFLVIPCALVFLLEGGIGEHGGEDGEGQHVDIAAFKVEMGLAARTPNLEKTSLCDDWEGHCGVEISETENFPNY